MNVGRMAVGVGAAILLGAQGVASLAVPPSESNSYSGTTGDLVNNGLFAAGLTLLGVFLLSRRPARGLVGTGFAVAAVGCLMLAVSTAVTMAAGEERWDIVFIAGFGLAELGWLIALFGQRTLGIATLLPGLVLTLAFFDSAGGIALGLATLLVALESPVTEGASGEQVSVTARDTRQ